MLIIDSLSMGVGFANIFRDDGRMPQIDAQSTSQQFLWLSD